jgi:asparagine synthase (glutamine-hydrolysing)
MCGILGRISLQDRVDPFFMKKALDQMTHRGPDASGEWMNEEANMWMGHRRLSIIDLSDAGSQPMVSYDKRLVVVFNGEIYNYIPIRDELKSKGYTFYSSSDTEVLLNAWHCWGEDCLNLLDGMFAFAILDTYKNKLILARDRIGEKPLYYLYSAQGCIFSSELKSILCLKEGDNRINHLALDCLLGFGYVPGDLCIVEGIKKLPPASFMLWQIGMDVPVIKTYWEAPLPKSEFEEDERLIEELDEILGVSVKSQMVADVPVGVMLSGGLDSSLITSYASEKDMDMYTFTVGFEGYGGADERHFARQIAQWFGTRHKELNVDGANPDIMSKLASQCCEPNTDPAIIPGFLIYKAASEYCKVVMGGDGGDEIFGGYDRYEQWMQLKNRVINVPMGLRNMISGMSEKLLPIGFKGRYYLMQMEADFERSIPLKDNLFTAEERRKILPTSWIISETDSIKNFMVHKDLDFMERAMRYDMKGFLPDNILTKVDRSSMLSSVEVRSPFLSKRILEFAMADVKPELKRRKKILRKVAEKRLPSFFNFQRKQGFVPPLEYWMQEKKWQEFIKDHLFSSNSLFNKGMLNTIMKGEGKQFFNKRRLFALIMIQLWMNQYNIKA